MLNTAPAQAQTARTTESAAPVWPPTGKEAVFRPACAPVKKGVREQGAGTGVRVRIDADVAATTIYCLSKRNLYGL